MMSDLKTEYINNHIPYRIRIIEHHLDMSFPYDVDESYFHSSFLASVVTARLLINFLGIGYNEDKGELTIYKRKKDDVGLEDISNNGMVLPSELSDKQRNALIQLILLANKSVAHLTKPLKFEGNSFYELNSNLEIVKNLVYKRLPELDSENKQ